MIRIGRIHIPPPPPRVVAYTMLTLVIATLLVALRGENTRDHVQRVDSACARANSNYATVADVAECAAIRREADRARSLRDSCIVLQKTLKPHWYQVVSKCQRLPARELTPKVTPSLGPRSSSSG